ncbi:hypothetical protein Zm00014a_015133 [Zea mays]|uniref:Uncharacterized protein n=2 Tax=Zea mays TaxID=4577 RepID=A0A8J8Y9R8_MAIZE|nr:hypothetical protein ZEAMMB73_Zm00001d005747 [Zea mays]PWZ40619.1 hypothetical protein Zm00014a_015133 [Zea mays]
MTSVAASPPAQPHCAPLQWDLGAARPPRWDLGAGKRSSSIFGSTMSCQNIYQMDEVVKQLTPLQDPNNMASASPRPRSTQRGMVHR